MVSKRANKVTFTAKKIYSHIKGLEKQPLIEPKVEVIDEQTYKLSNQGDGKNQQKLVNSQEYEYRMMEMIDQWEDAYNTAVQQIGQCKSCKKFDFIEIGRSKSCTCGKPFI